MSFTQRMCVKWPTALCALLLCCCNATVTKKLQDLEENRAAKWLTDTYEPEMTIADYAQTVAEWSHIIHMTDTSANNKFIDESKKLDAYKSNASLKAKKFRKIIKKFSDPTVERQLKMISDDGFNINNDVEFKVLNDKLSALKNENLSFCDWELGKENCSEKLGWDEIQTIFNARDDYDKIKNIWNQFYVHDAPKKPIYASMVTLLNRKARENGYKDFGAYRRRLYKDATVDRLWMEILPLYEQIHTYSTIPMYLTNMWVQAWSSDPKLVYPYPRGTELNVTKLLLDKDVTVEQMYRKADDFVDSIGLKRVENSFWNKSVFGQPSDPQDDTCESNIYDFADGKDVRVKSCSQVNLDRWKEAHKVIGFGCFITYSFSQPSILRRYDHNPIATTMRFVFEMASKTAKRLHTVGLFEGKDTDDVKAYEMNDLMNIMLDQVVFLGGQTYVQELWRWNVFEGSYKVGNWEKHFLELSRKYIGFAPEQPIPKNSFITSSHDNIQPNIAGLPGIVNLYLQFQLFEGLCNISGHKGPLHQCDFYGSKAAGNAIQKAFKLGASKPMMKIVEIITGQRAISGKPLMRYFKPLYDWLKKKNDNATDCYGWGFDWPAKLLKNLETNRCRK